jgi:hypothetical protein
VLVGGQLLPGNEQPEAIEKGVRERLVINNTGEKGLAGSNGAHFFYWEWLTLVPHFNFTLIKIF